jgi:putative addiction module killer protein
VYDILHYKTADGVDIFGAWLEDLSDRTAAARVAARIDRVGGGNLGDHKSVDGGIWELRIDYGPGYRVYYALAGRRVILLLCGGDKRKQDSDIRRASSFLKDYNDRIAKP